MIDKLKLFFIITLTAIVLSLLWVRFFRSLPSTDYSVNDKPIIAINYWPEGNSPSEISSDITKKIGIASDIFAMDRPEVKEAAVIYGDTYDKIADFNLFVGSSRDGFVASADIVNSGTDLKNFTSEILNDGYNQRIMTISPNAVYDAYFRLEASTSYVPSTVIINDVRYPIKNVKNDLYEIQSFRSSEMASIGVKPDGDQYKIQDVIFVTGKLISEKSLQPIRKGAGKEVFTVNGHTLTANVPDNTYGLIGFNSGLSLESCNITCIQPMSITEISYQKQYSGILPNLYPKLDFASSKTFSLISSSADYTIENDNFTKRFCKYLFVSIIVLLISLAIIFLKTLIVYLSKFSEANNWLKGINQLFEHRIGELVIYGIIILVLLIIRLDYMRTNVLTSTNILIISFIMLLAFLRFAVKFLVEMLILSILVVALLSQLEYLGIADKVGNIVFLLIFIILLRLLVTCREEYPKKQFPRNKINK